MPIIEVNMLEGRSVTQKRAMIAAITVETVVARRQPRAQPGAIQSAAGVDRTRGHARKTKKPSSRQARRRFPRGLVAKGGIEPPTRGFSIRCSTN